MIHPADHPVCLVSSHVHRWDGHRRFDQTTHRKNRIKALGQQSGVSANSARHRVRSPSCNMGKGGDASVVHRPSSKVSKRVPVEKPAFTVGTLRRAIPPHCFERSLLRSSGYVAADLLGMAALYFCSTFIDQPAVPRWLAYGLLWPTYWFFQGAVGTGVWVIAHECGHQAFSKWQVVNDAVGLTLHSCLLVPYYSW